jgi:hypothetical protein
MGIPVNCLDCTETMNVPDYDTDAITCWNCDTIHEVSWVHYNGKGVRVSLPVEEDEDE